MSSINGVNNFKGIGGLATGLDTDSLVEAMLMGTQSKIDKHNQDKQVLVWQQEQYRNIINSISDFRSKYVSSSFNTPVLNDRHFNPYSISSSEDSITVSGNSDTASRVVLRNISSIASKSHVTTTKTATDSKIVTGDILENKDKQLLQGQSFSFELENESFTLTFSEDVTYTNIDDVVNELNTQIAENDSLKDVLNVSKDVDGKIEITATDNKTIKIVAGNNDVLKALDMTVGQEGVGSIKSTNPFDVANLTETLSLKDTLKDQTIKFELNGQFKEIVFSGDGTGVYDNASNLSTYLQTELDKAFGSGKVTVTNNSGKLEFQSVSSNDIFGIKSSTGTDVLGENGVLGVKATSYNRLDMSAKVSDANLSGLGPSVDIDGEMGYQFTINNETITISENDTVSQMLSKINDSNAGVKLSYSSLTNSFIMESEEEGAHSTINFSDNQGNFLETLIGNSSQFTKVAGQDTTLEISVDGGNTFNTISRASNNFNVDGLDIIISEEATKLDQAKEITFTTTNNTDEVIDRIKTFVEDYNKLIDEINGKVNEEKFSSFKPLTELQKEEMSEKQIEQWEEKAQSGLLRGDSNLRKFVNDLRSAIYEKVESAGLSVYDVGISTGSYKDNGKLKIDESKLRAAVVKDSEAVSKLFFNEPAVDKTSPDYTKQAGIINRFDSIFNDAVGTYKTTGTLIRRAGIVNHRSYSDNFIHDRIKTIDDAVTSLRRKLENEQDYYWKQFTNLEKVISELNSQSDWLSQQMMGFM